MKIRIILQKIFQTTVWTVVHDISRYCNSFFFLFDHHNLQGHNSSFDGLFLVQVHVFKVHVHCTVPSILFHNYQPIKKYKIYVFTKYYLGT